MHKTIQVHITKFIFLTQAELRGNLCIIFPFLKFIPLSVYEFTLKRHDFLSLQQFSK